MTRLVATLALPCILLTTAAPTRAQDHTGHDAHTGYGGVEFVAGLPLTAAEVEALEAGAGAGQALPAELSSYPGPRHVLELATELGLGAEQRSEVQRIFDAMLAEAQSLGREVLEAERALMAVFAAGDATADSVDAATARVATLRGRLQAVHLRAHLATRALLSTHQVHRYDLLRGYSTEHGG